MCLNKRKKKKRIKEKKRLISTQQNLMRNSVSFSRKLGLGKLKPTQMSLQLADGSVKHPRGVKEDVLIKVGKFTFPTDFVVIDMEEDKEMPLILGRPFLATDKVVIEVQEGKLRLRVGKEEITFNVFNALKHPLHTNHCFIVDSSDSLACQFVQDAMKDPLEATLTIELKEDELDEEKSIRVAYCDANHPWKKPERMKLEDMGYQRDLTPHKSSIEEPPTRELKPQPPHLKYVHLKRTKLAPDKRITSREFKEGEVVMLYNSKLRLLPGKRKSRWTDPYKITKVFPSGVLTLRDWKNEPFTVHAQ
ncbi:uncharacterized protein LOC142504954 [Primulina tabacum]|uniref:uncharacterized protein LOC142504954 n=1 Tax=Primulina tabacum TaxID=48773 RepID=UPI003F59A770